MAADSFRAGGAIAAPDAALALALFTCGVVKRPLPAPLRKLAPERLWALAPDELAAHFKLTRLERERLMAFRAGFSPAHERQALSRQGIEFAALGQEDYPPALAQIFDPPAGIFVIGGGAARPLAHLGELMAGHRIAVVGARAASRYGLDAAGHLAGALASSGVCICSGLAFGVDAAAHRAAIESTGGTVAVLGCGPDRIYPRANAALYRKILKSGVVISEYPPGTAPLPWRFPARNRIIAGLSEGVIVVEAREKSGALITADFCLEQGKDVFAVPGSIFSELSAGPHQLIRSGAVPVARPDDVFEVLGIEPRADRAEAASPPLGEDEARLYRQLTADYRHLDLLAAGAGLESGAAAGALVSLEIKGLARHDPGCGYARSPQAFAGAPGGHGAGSQAGRAGSEKRGGRG